MKRFPTISLTAILTTAALFSLVKAPFTGPIILSLIDPVGPTNEYVLTQDAEIRAKNQVVGTLKAGQILYPQTRHDGTPIFRTLRLKMYFEPSGGTEVTRLSDFEGPVKTIASEYELFPMTKRKTSSDQ